MSCGWVLKPESKCVLPIGLHTCSLRKSFLPTASTPFSLEVTFSLVVALWSVFTCAWYWAFQPFIALTLSNLLWGLIVHVFAPHFFFLLFLCPKNQQTPQRARDILKLFSSQSSCHHNSASLCKRKRFLFLHRCHSHDCRRMLRRSEEGRSVTKSGQAFSKRTWNSFSVHQRKAKRNQEVSKSAWFPASSPSLLSVIHVVVWQETKSLVALLVQYGGSQIWINLE